MSPDETNGGDAFRRPADPAGTRPKVDPSTLVPKDVAPLLSDTETDAEAVEIDEYGAEIRPPEPRSLPSPNGAPLPEPVAMAPTTALVLPEPTGGLARPRAAASPHAPRFQFILGALIALGASGVLLTFAVLHSGRAALPQAWSSWQPALPGYDGATQIANHVGGEYRLTDGSQLATISSGPPAIAGVPVTVGVRSRTTGSISSLGAATVLYTMCGGNPDCTIVGKPSADRLLLVKREALELALYTYRYLGPDDVVVLTPPVKTRSTTPTGRTTTQRLAILLPPQNLRTPLSRPLPQTLTTTTPSVTTVTRAADTLNVTELTAGSAYGLDLRQSSTDGSYFLILQPFANG